MGVLIENDQRVDHVEGRRNDIGDRLDRRWTVALLLSLLTDRSEKVGLIEIDVLGENDVGLLLLHECDSFRWLGQRQRAHVQLLNVIDPTEDHAHVSDQG